MSYYPESGTPPQAAPTSSTAIISLIMGILGLTMLPFVGSIVALITGPMARREIRESGGTLGGEGMATAGIVLGWIGVGLFILTICTIGAAVGIPICIGILSFIFNRTTSLILPLLVGFA